MRIRHQSFSDLDRVPICRATLARHAAAVAPVGVDVVLHGVRPGTYGQDFARSGKEAFMGAAESGCSLP